MFSKLLSCSVTPAGFVLLKTKHVPGFVEHAISGFSRLYQFSNFVIVLRNARMCVLSGFSFLTICSLIFILFSGRQAPGLLEHGLSGFGELASSWGPRSAPILIFHIYIYIYICLQLNQPGIGKHRAKYITSTNHIFSYMGLGRL